MLGELDMIGVPELNAVRIVQQLPGCGYHWELTHGGVQGTRHKAVKEQDWIRECGVAARYLGIELTRHLHLGAYNYVAFPLPAVGPALLLAQRVVIWMARLSEYGYAGTIDVGVVTTIGQFRTLTLDQAELSGLAAQTLSIAGLPVGDADDDTYMQAYHEIGDKLWQDWYGPRLQAMGTLVAALAALGETK